MDSAATVGRRSFGGVTTILKGFPSVQVPLSCLLALRTTKAWWLADVSDYFARDPGVQEYLPRGLKHSRPFGVLSASVHEVGDLGRPPRRGDDHLAGPAPSNSRP